MNAARSSMTQEAAQDIAIDVLTFLSDDSERLERFFTDTGLYPQTLVEEAHTPPVMAAILDHLLTDESLLLVFCAQNGTDPESIAPAHSTLVAIGDG